MTIVDSTFTSCYGAGVLTNTNGNSRACFINNKTVVMGGGFTAGSSYFGQIVATILS